MVPVGIKIIIHEKPQEHKTFGKHNIKGWYLGSAWEHDQNYIMDIPEIHSKRIGDVVKLFPTHCKMPNMSSANVITIVA